MLSNDIFIFPLEWIENFEAKDIVGPKPSMGSQASGLWASAWPPESQVAFFSLPRSTVWMQETGSSRPSESLHYLL